SPDPSSPLPAAAPASTATATTCGASSLGSGSGGDSGETNPPGGCVPPSSVVVQSARTRVLSRISSGEAHAMVNALSPRVSVWSSAGSAIGQYGYGVTTLNSPRWPSETCWFEPRSYTIPE